MKINIFSINNTKIKENQNNTFLYLNLLIFIKYKKKKIYKFL